MAEDLAKLIVTLEASTKQYERALAKANSTTVAQLMKMEKSAKAGGDKIGAAMAQGILSKLGGIGGIFAGALGGMQFQKFADSFTRIQNNLKVAGLSGGGLNETLSELYTIAQRTGTPLEALSELYSKVSQAQKTLGATSSELVGFTSIVANALQVSGKSASESAGALLQLGQSLSSGKVQAEEYNSMLEGMYPLLQAAAAGLKEAGGDVSKLTQLVKGGKISSEVFFRAIEAGSPILTQKLSTATATTGQGITKLGNDMTIAAGKIDQAFSATAKLNSVLALTGDIAKKAAEGVNSYATAYERIAKGKIAQAETDIVAAAKNNPALANVLKEFRPDLAKQLDAGGYQTGGTMDGAYNAPSRAQLYNRPRPVVPISTSDYAAPPGSAGGSKAAKVDADVKAYEREVAAIKEKTAALQVEKDNIGKTAYEQEKARVAQDLMNAATKAYGANAAAMKPQIDSIAGAYAKMKVEVDETRESLERQQQAMKDLAADAGAAAGDWLVDFKNGLMEAKTAAEAARVATANLLNSMADQALRMAGNAAIMALFQAFGLLPANTATTGGGIPSLLFGGGRAGGGPVVGGRAYRVGESGPETVVMGGNGMVYPDRPTTKQSSNVYSIDSSVHINAPNSDAAALARLEARVTRQLAEQEQRIPKIVSAHRSHGRM